MPPIQLANLVKAGPALFHMSWIRLAAPATCKSPTRPQVGLRLTFLHHEIWQNIRQEPRSSITISLPSKNSAMMRFLHPLPLADCAPIDFRKKINWLSITHRDHGSKHDGLSASTSLISDFHGADTSFAIK